MKIKTKLIVSLGFLFALTVALATMSIMQVRQLGQETSNILVANYQSLDYSRKMYKVLDESIRDIDTVTFKGYLDAQLKNITEIGEKELTLDLKSDFKNFQASPTDANLAKIRNSLNSIMKLNMDAIERKGIIAEKTAEQSILWISLTSTICFIIGFTLIVNLPGYIANPVRELTESIKQIAAQNYSQRVHHGGHDEFAALARSFNTMAQKLEEYSNSSLAKLMIEKRRIETLINNLSDPIIGLDDKNNILFINEKALEITRLDAVTAVGQKAEELALKNDLLRVLLQKMISNESQVPENIKIYFNKKESHFEQSMVPIVITPTGETEKRMIGTFLILKDITPYKELDSAKTNFIATVSHEFKTPIASMKMSLQLLENNEIGPLNEEQKNLIESLRDDTERLLRTTGELLNITQVETGKSQFKIQSMEVGSLIDECIGSNQKAAIQKNIRIIRKVPSGLPRIVGDHEKTQWIISNLISNAIRYSYENIEIKVETCITPTHVEVSIQDFGIGISQEYHDKVFEKYFRVPGNQKEGTGLGLSISKEFLTSMGGYIQLKSDLGKGSTFTAGFKISQEFKS